MFCSCNCFLLKGDYSDLCKTFSVLYVLVGAIFATRAIVSLAENAVKNNESIQQQIQIREVLISQTSLKGVWADYYVWGVMSSGRFFVVYLWILYLFMGVAWSCNLLNWSIIDGVYFSVSSMSTGGLWCFAEDSPPLI